MKSLLVSLKLLVPLETSRGRSLMLRDDIVRTERSNYSNSTEIKVNTLRYSIKFN